MKISKPMTMADAARFLRDGCFGFGTLRAATAFLRDVRDDARMRNPGTGDRPAYSVDYTSQRRFIVMEDEPGCTCPSCTANQPERQRLEYLRGELRGERISYGELAELQSLTTYIDPGDTELLGAAGVPEFPEADSMTRPVTGPEAGAALGYISGSVRAGERRAWTDSEIPDDALDRALGDS